MTVFNPDFIPGVLDPEYIHEQFHIFGCGGMGSRMAEALVRTGFGIAGKNPIFLYDYDHFEQHNMRNQWVVQRRIGKPKVHAVRDAMREISPNAVVVPRMMEVATPVPVSGIAILCLDSMAARRTIVDQVLRRAPSVVCVIETRMDAGVGISHCFDPHNANQLACWRMYWHSDAEADNIAGCHGTQPVIASAYGTSMLAMKQLEMFVRIGDTAPMPNRVYCDFDEFECHKEEWSKAA